MARQPEKIGPYQIQSELGRGGMAVVYRAVDSRTNRVVALKVLPTGYMQDDRLVRRFLRESRMMASMRHPNVVEVYDTGQSNDYFYIAMEQATGGTLANRLKNPKPLTNREIASILSQVAAGLDYAHSQGLVHRDIKPSNIMFTQDGRAILTDFGIAKDLGGNQSRITVIGTTIGTPAYMSPEQARAEREIDHRSDIYSLGVVAYHLLTGRVPFSATSHGALIGMIASRRPPPAQSVNPRIPTGVARALDQALALDPQQRFASAGAFARTLAGMLGQNEAPVAVAGEVEEQTIASSATLRPQRLPRPSGDGLRRGLGSVFIFAGGILAVLTLFWVLAGQLQLLPGERGAETGQPVSTPVVPETPTAASVAEDIGGESAQPGDTPTPSPTAATQADMPSPTPTGTATSSPTSTATASGTATPTATPTVTARLIIVSPLPTISATPVSAGSSPMPTMTPTTTPTATRIPITNTFTATPRPGPIGPTSTPTRLVIGGAATATPTPRSVRATSTPFVPPTATPTRTPPPTPTFPPATATPIPSSTPIPKVYPTPAPISYPTSTPLPPTPPNNGGGSADSGMARFLLGELSRSSVPLSYPGEAENFVINLAGYMGDFNSGTEPGNRTKALIQNVWSDWLTKAEGNPYGRTPGNELSTFRQLVVRIIQGSQGSLSSSQQSAIINFYTRYEDPNIWFGNINGVIGAINRENF